MKRQRLTLVAALAAAFIAFAPRGAQNAAKKPIELQDILSIRAIGATSLSTNGQWYSYRLAPLQGDSDVIVKSTAAGAPDMKFAAVRPAVARTFSADSTWAGITVTRRAEALANTRAAAEPEQRHAGESRVR
jgi:hypothetical protein